ncbi:MAG: hypothetical protein AcusKO_18570 [Acuticoccus sp.]
MASRAYFRCRACGEPVMAGAYRCPVCGIDFPSGTPGAPERTDSGAADARVRPAAPPPTPDSDNDSLDFAPGGAAARESGARPRGAAELDVRPREAGERAEAGAASLSVRPARESVAVAVAQRETSRELVPSRRRSWAKSLAGTLTSAILILGLVAGGAFLFQHRDLLRAIGGGGSAPAQTVALDDGWVTLSVDERPLTVSADGPFRLRVSGKVYSLPAGQAIKVPPDVEAAVRVVRGTTTATVTPQ